MRSRGFLVVGEGIGSYFPSTLERFGLVFTARSIAEATRIWVQERKALTGLFVDVVLADGSGFELITRMRGLGMELPALVVTPHVGHQLRTDASRAFFLDVPWLAPPVADDLIVKCVERWDKTAAEDEAEDELVFQNYVALTGTNPDEAKAIIQSVLEKTGARTLAEGARRFERQAWELEERGLPEVDLEGEGPIRH